MKTRRCFNVGSIVLQVVVAVCTIGLGAARGQELGGAGTVQGTVKDPTGGVMQSVEVKISNPVSGFNRTTTTDAMGKYVFRNLAPNPYHISVTAQGFQTLERDVNVRTSVPIDVDLTLALAGTTSSVEVVAHVEELLERDPTAHTDVDQSLIDKLPIETSSGLNQVITMASPGVVADANGFFHPIGDHAQTQFSIDNQPVTDQQSRIYSNQISPDAVQSMELITGVPPAEFGDKRQPGRPNHHQVGSRPVEAGRQFLGRLRLVQESHRRARPRRGKPPYWKLPLSEWLGHGPLPRPTRVSGLSRPRQ